MPNIRTSSLVTSLALGASLALVLQATACSSDTTAPAAGGTGGTDAGNGSGGASSGGASSGGASSGGASSGGASSGGATGSGGDGGVPEAGPDVDGGCKPAESLAPRTDVAAAIDVPTGATMLHHFHADGKQTYKCTEVLGAGDAGSTYEWGGATHASTPDAQLVDSCGVAVIHHFGVSGVPHWKWLTEGTSEVTGAKKAADAKAGTIAWLLLQATPSGSGELAAVSWIQRLDTTGGAFPATGCDLAHVNDTVDVPYTAEYYFYEHGLPDGG